MKKLILSTLILMSSSAVIADMDREIAYLLSTVKNSDCTFERNGKEYSGSGALEHIQKKLDYFQSKISSAEDFILYSASKSTMSGKAYWISCPSNERIKSQDWLLKQLKEYRKQEVNIAK